MTHKYLRHCFRKSDGRRFQEQCTISGEEVAMQRYGGNGGRSEFLELLNRWNSNGTLNGEYFYCYVALESAH